MTDFRKDGSKLLIIGLYRKKKGLTQSDLAKKIGVTNAYISRIENGAQIPRADVLYKIAKELGVTMEQLMEED